MLLNTKVFQRTVPTIFGGESVILSNSLVPFLVFGLSVCLGSCLFTSCPFSFLSFTDFLSPSFSLPFLERWISECFSSAPCRNINRFWQIAAISNNSDRVFWYLSLRNFYFYILKCFKKKGIFNWKMPIFIYYVINEIRLTRDFSRFVNAKGWSFFS